MHVFVPSFQTLLLFSFFRMRITHFVVSFLRGVIFQKEDGFTTSPNLQHLSLVCGFQTSSIAIKRVDTYRYMWCKCTQTQTHGTILYVVWQPLSFSSVTTAEMHTSSDETCMWADTDVCECKRVLARCHFRADIACHYRVCRNVWSFAPPPTWHDAISQTNPKYQLVICWWCVRNGTPYLNT